MFPQVSFKEILPAIAKILITYQRTMEWNEGECVKTWCQNSLGLVKFYSQLNAIYLHDTPSKYFLVEKKEPLATVVSGVKPAELANKIMEDDPIGIRKN
jgi:hypothetical protein